MRIELVGLLAEKLWRPDFQEIELKDDKVPSFITCDCKSSNLSDVYITNCFVYDGVKKQLFYGQCHKCQKVYWRLQKLWN